MFFGDPGAGAADVAGFWIIFSAWVLGELWFQWKRRLPPGGTGADRGSMWLLIASVWIGLILGITAAAAVPSAAIATARHELFTGGLLIMAMGLALRWYAVATLGSAFTVRVGTAAGQTLIETGPFRWMHHPSYSGSLLTILGVLVCCGNFLSLLALALPLAGRAYRIRLEENVLVGASGDPYRRYMSRRKSLIPKLL
jgi:protein-S-isoprenylcysteine O-methyltransferase